MFKITNNLQAQLRIGLLTLDAGSTVVMPSLAGLDIDDAIRAGSVTIQEVNNVANRCVGHQQFAAGAVDTAQALTIPTGAVKARIKASAQAIRIREDGTNPTSAIGYPLATGVEYICDVSDLTKVRLIAQVGGAIVDIIYYGFE